MSDQRKIVAQNIKNFISERGIKQSFIAEKANIPSSAFSKMLAGEQTIDMVAYFRICKALDVPMEKFFEE
jgi:transcriptional regulator with XRE-family HTH domain